MVNPLVLELELELALLKGFSSNNDEEQYLEEKNNYIEKLRGRRLEELE